MEEVLEVEDFKPTSQNRSVGVAVSNSSSNHSDKSSKVVEKILKKFTKEFFMDKNNPSKAGPTPCNFFDIELTIYRYNDAIFIPMLLSIFFPLADIL